MKTDSQFSVHVTDDDRISFADFSGDHNPLHVEGRVNGTRIVLVSAYLKKQ